MTLGSGCFVLVILDTYNLMMLDRLNLILAVEPAVLPVLRSAGGDELITSRDRATPPPSSTLSSEHLAPLPPSPLCSHPDSPTFPALPLSPLLYSPMMLFLSLPHSPSDPLLTLPIPSLRLPLPRTPTLLSSSPHLIPYGESLPSPPCLRSATAYLYTTCCTC